MVAVKQKYGSCIKCVTALVIAAFLSSSAAQAAPNRYETSHLAPESRTIGDRHEDEREAYKLLYEKIEVSRGKKQGPADEVQAARTALNFLKQNGLRMLVLTGLIAGIHLATAAPALGFDGKAFVGGLSTIGMIIGNILVFSIIFTVIASFFPAAGALFALGLNVALNVAFYYGYRWYAEYKQRQFEMAQRLPAPKIKAPPVKPVLPPSLPKPAVDRKVPEAVKPVVPGGAKIINLAEYRKKKEQEAAEGKKQGPSPLVVSEEEAAALAKKAEAPPQAADTKGKKAPSPQKKMIISAQVEEPSSMWDEVGNICKKLTGLFGVFFPVVMMHQFMFATKAWGLTDGAEPGSASTVSIASAFVFSAAFLASAYMYCRYVLLKPREPEQPAMPETELEPLRADVVSDPASMKKFNEYVMDEINKPGGLEIVEFFLEMYLLTHIPLAVFNAETGDDGSYRLVLDKGYADGRNSFANDALRRNGRSMDYIIDKMAGVTKLIEKEPNGKAVKRVVVIDEDSYHMKFRKYINVMITTLPMLEHEGVLETYHIPHEVYHTVITGDISIEEVLVHALGLTRFANYYKDGKTDPEKKRIYERTLEDFAIMESKKTKGLKMRPLIESLIASVEERMAAGEVTSEDILDLAKPLALEYLMGNKVYYGYVVENLEKMTEAAIFAKVDEMWKKHQGDLLQGRPLYSFVLPFALLDFSDAIAPSATAQIVLRSALIGMAIANKSTVAMVKDAYGKFVDTTQRFRQLKAPEITIPQAVEGQFALDTAVQTAKSIAQRSWYFLTLYVPLSLLYPTPLNAMTKGGSAQSASLLEGSGPLLIALGGAAALLAFIGYKLFAVANRSTQSPVRSLIGETVRKTAKLAKDNPPANEFASYFLDLHVSACKPVAIFERRVQKGGLVSYQLAKAYQNGQDALSNEILQEHNLTMDYIEQKIGSIARMLQERQAGEGIQRIVIGSMPYHNLQLHKLANTLILQLPLLEKESLLKVLFIPHECYHLMVNGDVEIEELLVHALGFQAALGVYRAGKQDPAARADYQQAMSALREIERIRGERFTQFKAINALRQNVEDEEARLRRQLTDDEVLWMAVPIALRFLRDNPDLFDFGFVSLSKKLSATPDPEVMIKVRTLHNASKNNILKGNVIYINLAPIVLLDFSAQLSPEGLKQFLFALTLFVGFVSVYREYGISPLDVFTRVKEIFLPEPGRPARMLDLDQDMSDSLVTEDSA